VLGVTGTNVGLQLRQLLPQAAEAWLTHRRLTPHRRQLLFSLGNSSTPFNQRSVCGCQLPFGLRELLLHRRQLLPAAREQLLLLLHGRRVVARSCAAVHTVQQLLLPPLGSDLVIQLLQHCSTVCDGGLQALQLCSLLLQLLCGCRCVITEVACQLLQSLCPAAGLVARNILCHLLLNLLHGSLQQL
jgi:hypothetical protein